MASHINNNTAVTVANNLLTQAMNTTILYVICTCVESLIEVKWL